MRRNRAEDIYDGCYFPSQIFTVTLRNLISARDDGCLLCSFIAENLGRGNNLQASSTGSSTQSPHSDEDDGAGNGGNSTKDKT